MKDGRKACDNFKTPWRHERELLEQMGQKCIEFATRGGGKCEVRGLRGEISPFTLNGGIGMNKVTARARKRFIPMPERRIGTCYLCGDWAYFEGVFYTMSDMYRKALEQQFTHIRFHEAHFADDGSLVVDGSVPAILRLIPKQSMRNRHE